MRPSGIPVSRSLIVRPGIANDDLREAIEAINLVHGDGDLPPIAVRLTSAITTAGQDSADGRLSFGLAPDGRITPNSITVRSDAPNRRFVLLHEVGHALDAFSLPGPGFASAASTIEEMDEWRDAVVESRAFYELRRLAESPDRDRARQIELMRAEELWARTYSQFVAVRSKDQTILAGLAALRQRAAETLYYPRQWDDDDFIAIDRAIERLFRRLGWMEPSSVRRPNGRLRR